MAKKRSREADGQQELPEASAADRMDEDESSDDEDFDVVNVDFEWFNFDAEIDFHGVKTLLRQLFDVDASLFDVSGLADLILGQPTIGSTVKVDGKENDAYAFLTALSLREHRDKKAVEGLTRYLAEKAATSEQLAAAGVPELLLSGLNSGSAPDAGAKQPHVGLVLAERLINMPPEISPPMYAMLAEEVEAAVEDGEPYAFTHYLILSKTYREVQSVLEAGEADRRRKKARDEAPLYYFHPEDEVLQKHAAAWGGYAFTRDDEAVADSRRAFQEMGVKAQGSMILIEAGKFEAAVKAISEYLSPPS